MPREMIYNSVEVPTEEGGTPPVLAVDLSWGRESAFVQIGTVDTSAEPFSEKRGWYVRLERQQINKLIRDLRRARDAAYGADA